MRVLETLMNAFNRTGMDDWGGAFALAFATVVVLLFPLN